MLTTMCHSQILREDMPLEVIKCVQILTDKDNNTYPDLFQSDEAILANCLQQYMWNFGDNQWAKFNITEKDKRFINSLIGSLVHQGRQKRQAGSGGIFPQTGFKIRREYRRLSDGERFVFNDALRRMKASGQYDTFANLHSGTNVDAAHMGPSFPGWHRVYLALFEEALRRITPGFPISLPYWDSTLDFDMPNPVDSIIWSETFLGNGNGLVVTGPFRNWVTNDGPLLRNIGSGSSLFTKEIIAQLLTRCRNEEILFPTAAADYDFEGFHGGPHVWVNGHMNRLDSAAHDPVFFMHHAFVDYIWELFRIRQARFCGINPEMDYPAGAPPLHAPGMPLAGLPPYRNIDGYRNYWTRFWYRYERSPVCSIWQPFCGTPYLRCDVTRQRCVSVARMGPSPVPAGAAGFGGAAGATALLERTQGTPESNMQARAQVSMLRGRPFNAPPAEPRTQDAQIAMGGMRRKRSPNLFVDKTLPKPDKVNMFTITGRKQVPEPTFDVSEVSNVLELSNAAAVLDTGRNQSIANQSVSEGHAFKTSEPLPLLPVPSYHNPTINDLLKPHVLNDFIINGQTDRDQFSFIPVKINFTNKKLVFPNTNYSASSSQSTSSMNAKCAEDDSGTIQVRVESNGLSYSGTYANYALIDKHLPMTSVITYVGIKTPDLEPTRAILAAVHSCGTLCVAHCLVPESRSPVYKQCTGMIHITTEDTAIYGKTIEEAASRLWTRGVSDNMVPILFYCSNFTQ